MHNCLPCARIQDTIFWCRECDINASLNPTNAHLGSAVVRDTPRRTRHVVSVHQHGMLARLTDPIGLAQAAVAWLRASAMRAHSLEFVP